MTATASLTAARSAGSALGRYRILSELGQGGMAKVYLAEAQGPKGFRRLVALKAMHSRLYQDPESVEMFIDEALLAGRIRHPNVVSVHDVCEENGALLLVMEYIEGLPLSALMSHFRKQGRPMPLGAALRIVLDALRGLGAAHELTDEDGSSLNVVHRDISPKNVLVGVDGSARVTDFGIADTRTRSGVTSTGHVRGTLGYTAPERVEGMKAERHSDLFSVGVVFWELLTGERLYADRHGARDVLTRICFEEVPRPGARVDVPLGIESVCMQALQRNPFARYESTQEFAWDLMNSARECGVLPWSPEELGDLVRDVQDEIAAQASQRKAAAPSIPTLAERIRANRAQAQAEPRISEQPTERRRSEAARPSGGPRQRRWWEKSPPAWAWFALFGVTQVGGWFMP